MQRPLYHIFLFYQVGVLKGRIYDIELVTSHRGVLNVNNNTNIMTGIKNFLKNLRDTGEGFLVDEHTFYSYLVISSQLDLLTKEEKEQLKHGIILVKTEVRSKYSFGMLVRSEAMYRYLLKFVENNKYLMDGCRRNYINHLLSNSKTYDSLQVERSGVFSADGGLFMPTLIASSVLLGVSVLIGAGYEMWRHLCRNNLVFPS